MLTVEEVEQLRRSAAMAPLGLDSVARLIESCAEMADERRQIARLLATLPSTVAELRAALNELHAVVK